MDKKLPKSMEEMIKNVREKLGNEKKLGDMFEKCTAFLKSSLK